MNKEKKKLEECFCKEIINDETLTKANAILVIKCADLEQKIKKQKEVIDKAINWTIKYQTEWCQEDEVIRDLKQLLDILNEVSK